MLFRSRHCRRTSSAPTATAGRSSPTRPGIPSACAATKGSRGPATKRSGPDYGSSLPPGLSPHPPRFTRPPGQVIPALPGHDNAPAHSPRKAAMFPRPSVKHVLGLIRKASGGTRQRSLRLDGDPRAVRWLHRYFAIPATHWPVKRARPSANSWNVTLNPAASSFVPTSRAQSRSWPGGLQLSKRTRSRVRSITIVGSARSGGSGWRRLSLSRR